MTTWEKLMLKHAQAQTSLLVGLLAATAGEKVLGLMKEMVEIEQLQQNTDKALEDPNFYL